MSNILLMLSILAMLGGMFILIWKSTGNLSALERTLHGWWNSEAKLAATFTTVAFVVGALFLMQQFTLYSWQGEDDSDQVERTDSESRETVDGRKES